MEAEQSQNFNERLSQWVASQGFWFQVRYSMSGSGAKGTAMFHLLSMGFRLLIFLLVVLVAGWVYLFKRIDGAGFQEDLRVSVQAGLSGTDSEMRGFSHAQGQLEIGRYACEGGNETFFSSMEARNIRCNMGLLDGLRGSWQLGTVLISKLEMELRAGADDAESARMMSEAFFRRFPDVSFDSLEIAEIALRWGYSERTRGEIEGSALKMVRTDGSVKLVFRGGTFSQNWLRDLEIINLVVICTPEGITLEKAEFRSGGATVDLSGLRVTGGERPAVEGVAKVRKLELEQILPPAIQNFVEGSISGDFKVSGSTNSSEGIGFQGRVDFDGQDVIILRERLHLLKALSVVDYSRNYHRVDFREGGFEMKTSAGGLELTDVKLKADDLLTLEGAMRVRLPTPEETQVALSKSARGGAPIFSSEDAESDAPQAKNDAGDFTLKRAALEAKRIKEGKQAESSLSLLDRLGVMSLEMRRLEGQASERLSRTLQYEGAFRISLQWDAFERTPRLTAQYPLDPETKRIPMAVPIKGNLYEITLQQAEEVYQMGRR
jgi:hypothetical protein